jgi:hypothetical protein
MVASDIFPVIDPEGAFSSRGADLLARSCPDRLWKSLIERPVIEMPVIAVVVREAGPGQASARRDEAEDRALGDLVPADVEGVELRKETAVS